MAITEDKAFDFCDGNSVRKHSHTPENPAKKSDKNSKKKFQKISRKKISKKLQNFETLSKKWQQFFV